MLIPKGHLSASVMKDSLKMEFTVNVRELSAAKLNAVLHAVKVEWL